MSDHDEDSSSQLSQSSGTASVCVPSSPLTSPLQKKQCGSDDDDTVIEFSSSDIEGAYANQDSSNANSSSTDSIQLEDTTCSPLSSPVRHHGLKRCTYSTYKDDPSIPIPRQTLDRWAAKKRREDDCANDDCASDSVREANDIIPSQSDLEKIIVVDENMEGPAQYDDDARSNEASSTSGESDCNSENSDLSAGEGYASDDGGCSSLESTIGDYNDQFDDDSLYPGCQKTKDEAICELVQIYFSHNLTKTALKEILRLYTSSLPPCHNMPTSHVALLDYVEQISGPLNEKEHFYCRPQLHSVASNAGPCVSCGSCDIGVFYELPLVDRIKFLFEYRGLADLIDSYSPRMTARDGCIHDIVHGSEYRRIWTGTIGKYRVTLILNTDGVSPYKSSKAKMWLLMFTIMEIPPHLRSLFTMVWGVWFDKKHKPDMNLYLKPFVEALVKIEAEGGASWHHPETGDAHKSLVRSPVMVADAPARAGCLNCQEHQSKYACLTCEQKTNKLPRPPAVVGVKRKSRKRRFLFRENPATLRTHQKMIEYGNFAENSGEPKRGVKGPTVMENIPFIDLSACVHAEYMHCVLLGVVKQLGSLWFFEGGDWYIGDQLPFIDHFICNQVHPPDNVSRSPLSLENYFKHLKANEFRFFLLYSSVIALAPYMKEEFMQHWMLLVQSIFTLLSESISENDLISVDAMLRMFVRDIRKLYGEEQYVYNVHMLTHLVLYVRRFGPLWSNSAFNFENFNGLLSRMIHGSKNEGRELLNQLWHAQGAQILQSKTFSHARGADNSIKVLGAILTRTLSDIEADSLAEFNIDLGNIELYKRIMIGRQLFSSVEYDKHFKRCNSYVLLLLCNGQKIYGRIIVFCKSACHVMCLVAVYKVVHTKFFFHTESLVRLKHIVPVEDSGDIIAWDVKCIQQKLIQIGDYLCYPPDSVENFL